MLKKIKNEDDSQIIKNTGEPAEAKEYRKRHERTFTKTVYIGKRGQY